MSQPSVLVLGGGLAGLAAAAALGQRGFAVTILEARNRLGGRASSFTDGASGQLLDNCQHVSMGCCTNLEHFCRTVGIAHFLEPQPKLYFMTPDRRISRFGADPVPAPLHLARSFAQLHFLSGEEKLRAAWGLACLQHADDKDDTPFLDWLERHGQTPRLIRRFWGLVLTSALNETADRMGLRYARKVFRDGFLRHRRGFEVQLPTIPLGQLYGTALQPLFNQANITIEFGAAARRLLIEAGQSRGIELRDGSIRTANWYISAVPFDRLLELLPTNLIAAEPFHGLKHLETSPITSVHLWYDRPILNRAQVVRKLSFPVRYSPSPIEGVGRDGGDEGVSNTETRSLARKNSSFARGQEGPRHPSSTSPPSRGREKDAKGVRDARCGKGLPHVVLVDCLGQWVFKRGELSPGEHYVQVVVSASRELRQLGGAEIQARIIAEMSQLFPAAAPNSLLRVRVVTEHAATFSVLPGVDRFRPGQESPIPNLFLAGDWTATGWPATMEGAVRSGYLATEALLRRLGRSEILIQPDLA